MTYRKRPRLHPQMHRIWGANETFAVHLRMDTIVRRSIDGAKNIAKEKYFSTTPTR